MVEGLECRACGGSNTVDVVIEVAGTAKTAEWSRCFDCNLIWIRTDDRPMPFSLLVLQKVLGPRTPAELSDEQLLSQLSARAKGAIKDGDTEFLDALADTVDALAKEPCPFEDDPWALKKDQRSRLKEWACPKCNEVEGTHSGTYHRCRACDHVWFKSIPDAGKGELRGPEMPDPYWRAVVETAADQGLLLKRVECHTRVDERGKIWAVCELSGEERMVGIQGGGDEMPPPAVWDIMNAAEKRTAEKHAAGVGADPLPDYIVNAVKELNAKLDDLDLATYEKQRTKHEPGPTRLGPFIVTHITNDPANPDRRVVRIQRANHTVGSLACTPKEADALAMHWTPDIAYDQRRGVLLTISDPVCMTCASAQCMCKSVATNGRPDA